MPQETEDKVRALGPKLSYPRDRRTLTLKMGYMQGKKPFSEGSSFRDVFAAVEDPASRAGMRWGGGL
ncbi:MAG TPA: hypothetical protein PLK94_07925 [Alphaproteobacteria bacterium]|mgnify:CR=1 FL=1|nr:hypothetical protein [Alphaproteobacteria bacterium]HOO51196.1 hypothetical protein [Alphaproteobacteria bacterium]